jgi:hypothetical protein
VNRARHRIRIHLLAAAGLLLAGCDLLGGGESTPTIPKPATLHPESDAFAARAARAYFWKENLRRSGKDDSLLADFSLKATRGADTVIGGDTLARIAFEPTKYEGPVAAAAVSRLGFRPGRVLTDTSAVPDPGPDLPFPETPVDGWRHDTAIGDLRFVRALRGTETVKLSGKQHQCWAFAESTWRAGTLLGTGSTWMGREGLVRHRSEWPGLALSAGLSGALFREITAP